MFDPRLLYAVTGDLPASYKGVNSISIAVSPDEYEAAKARYTAYELLIEACRKCVVSLETRNMGRNVPNGFVLDSKIVERWRSEIEKADAAAISALLVALKAVEEAG